MFLMPPVGTYLKAAVTTRWGLGPGPRPRTRAAPTQTKVPDTLPSDTAVTTRPLVKFRTTPRTAIASALHLSAPSDCDPSSLREDCWPASVAHSSPCLMFCSSCNCFTAELRRLEPAPPQWRPGCMALPVPTLQCVINMQRGTKTRAGATRVRYMDMT